MYDTFAKIKLILLHFGYVSGFVSILTRLYTTHFIIVLNVYH